MLEILLCDNWICKALNGKPEQLTDDIWDIVTTGYAASVPGCVNTDLQIQGLLPDPFVDDNEIHHEWVGHIDWEYTCKFNVDQTIFNYDMVELCFNGIDTIADVKLNGEFIGHTDNMHHSHVFKCKDFLKKGQNEIIVNIKSPIAYSRAERDRCGMPDRFRAVWAEPYNYIRKMACNFGWDWGPKLLTAGIYKSVKLQAWNIARIDFVRPLIVDCNNDKATLFVCTDIAYRSSTTPHIEIKLSDPYGKIVYSSESCDIKHEIVIENPYLWWPRGHGTQPLYNLTVRLRDSQSRVILDESQSRFGIRTVKLDTDIDEIGRRFVIEINGKVIFCKGADWIPDDCFPSQMTQKRYHQRLVQAYDCNMNMLRVWGGGVYETDEFYDICDDLGIMVWQDFMFACALYPEEEPHYQQIKNEVEYNVKRLVRHPSLVLWNGGNECIWHYIEHDIDGVTFKENADGRTWGGKYYLELFPQVISKWDPTRPYWANSPYSGSMDIYPSNPEYGCTHLWHSVVKDSECYRNYIPRFASEFGIQGCCNFSTLKKSVSPKYLHLDNDVFNKHQKVPNGNKILTELIENRFQPGDNLTDWIYLSQLAQARGIQTAVEWQRSRFPQCTGTLYWQLNDCWPAVSWSAIDSQGIPKLLWYATRKFYSDRLIVIEPDNHNKLNLFICNDSDEVFNGCVRICRMDFFGKLLAESTFEISAEKRDIKSIRIPLTIADTVDTNNEFILAQVDNHRAFWFFHPDRVLRYPQINLKADINCRKNKKFLRITSKTFIRDLCVLIDILDPKAQIKDQLVTLLPGESFIFEIDSSEDIKINDLTRKPILQCANYYGLNSKLPIHINDKDLSNSHINLPLICNLTTKNKSINKCQEVKR